MKTILLLFLLLPFFQLTAKTLNDIDNKVMSSYPKKFSSIDKLVERLKKDFQTPREQVRALYCWMAHNIKYDVKGLNDNTVFQFSYSSEQEKLAIERKMFLEIATKTLKEKKAVCDGYSKLFKEVCDQLSIECEIVEGYSRVYLSDLVRNYKQPDHAWNAIKIDGEWYLVDATWGAGYLDASMKFVWEYETIYFMGSSDLFFKNHYPMNAKWKFNNKSLDDFKNQPLYYLTTVSANTNVVRPLDAILLQKNTNEIILNTTLEPNLFSFAYDKDEYLNELHFKKENGLVKLEITPSKKRSNYLTIYYDGKGIITYKVK